MAVSLLKRGQFDNTHRVTYRPLEERAYAGSGTLDIRVTDADVRHLGADMAAEIVACARIADVFHVGADRAFGAFRSVIAL